MTQTVPILVIGATGKVGSRIINRLTALGRAVRGASRRSTPIFDWQSQATWPAVLEGADVAFVSYVPDLAAKGVPETIKAFAERAVDAGIKRVVLLSGRGETNAQLSERIIQDCGLGHTVVRASWFNQNFSEGMLLPSVLAGIIAMPAGNRREPFIDVDDIADVAVAALIDEKHVGQVYEVTGPRLLSFADVAEEITAARGHRTDYVAISSDAFQAALIPEVGPDHAAFLTRLCDEVFDGRNESLADGVQRALGRQPRDFSAFCKGIAAANVWSPGA